MPDVARTPSPARFSLLSFTAGAARDVSSKISRRFLSAFNRPILGPVIKQRIALAYHDLLDFCDKDGMVARILRRVQAAFEVSQGAVEHRRAVRRPVKERARVPLRVPMILGRTRIVFRNGLL